MPKSSIRSLPSGLPAKILWAFLYAPCLPHARRAHLPRFGQPNTIWRRLQIMQLFVKQFRPAFCYFLRLRTKCLSLQLFSTPSAYDLPLLCDTKFHAHVKQGSKSVMYVSNPMFSVSKCKGTRFWITLRHYFARNFFVNEVCQCRPHIYIYIYIYIYI